MRFCLLGAGFLVFASQVCADSPASLSNVRADGVPPHDSRLAPLKDLNGHFPFDVPDSADRWRQRADELRRRVLVANGLWPMPEKTPLSAVVMPATEREGFTFHRVYFESLPGHYVTGLLFRPLGLTGKQAPGVLSPHGHGGRMQRHSEKKITEELAKGSERFEGSGRNPKIARCAQLARMGCVAFIFDMIGYEDSIQIPFEVAHRHAESRPAEAAGHFGDGWVFFSPEADLRLQSIMGLQTWNAIRALDFLASLPDVDPQRLAVTGGSGGGTQTILLSAIDDRVKVSFPNGMVSTSMQGGCYCENCNLLRIGTGNVELAALFAPKPLGMTAADDWTRDMMTDGFPELKRLYAMIGDQDDVMCRPLLQFPHNFNYVTRATMYAWMNKHLGLGLAEPIVEEDFTPLDESDGQVWSDDHPCPGTVGIEHEKSVCRWFDEQAKAELAVAYPKDAESLKKFREVYGQAWSTIFDQGLPDAEDVDFELLEAVPQDGYVIRKGVLSDSHRGAAIPVIIVRGADTSAESKPVILTTKQGKSVAFDESGNLSELVQSLLQENAMVILPDLIGQGELAAGAGESNSQRLVDTKKSYSAFTFGYNRTLAVERCADLCAVIGYANKKLSTPTRLLATEGTASWAAAASARAGRAIFKAVVNTDGFRFADVTSYRDTAFVPGAVKYGDIPAVLALRSPHRLMIIGEDRIPSLTKQAYDAEERNENIRISRDDRESLDWLMQ